MHGRGLLMALLIPSFLASNAHAEVATTVAEKDASAAEKCGSVVLRRCARSMDGTAPSGAAHPGSGPDPAPALQANRWGGPTELEEIFITADDKRKPSVKEVFERNLGFAEPDTGPDVSYQAGNGVRCTRFRGRTNCSDPQRGFRMSDSSLPTTNFNDLVF